jgi:hypothetical protein
MTRIRKAVFPVAGLGTRFLPATKAMPKEMLPVVDSGHAPPPHKNEAKDATPPSTSIVVMGDGMADWLAYGLEDAFADSPDVGIVRKNKVNSGLLRYDAKGDLDWWHQAREILGQEKANYVVMMIGVGDRQSIPPQERSVFLISACTRTGAPRSSAACDSAISLRSRMRSILWSCGSQ